MDDKDVKNNKEQVQYPTVYEIVTVLKFEPDTRQRTAQDFIHEQGTDSYCRQALSSVCVQDLHIIMSGMGLDAYQAHRWGNSKFFCHHEHVFYISFWVHVWRNVQRKQVCTTACHESTGSAW